MRIVFRIMTSTQVTIKYCKTNALDLYAIFFIFGFVLELGQLSRVICSISYSPKWQLQLFLLVFVLCPFLVLRPFSAIVSPEFSCEPNLDLLPGRHGSPRCKKTSVFGKKPVIGSSRLAPLYAKRRCFTDPGPI